MVAPTDSHEEARPETSYILPFPTLPLSFRADSALANMVGTWVWDRVLSSLIFHSPWMMPSQNTSSLVRGLDIPKKPNVAGIEPIGTGLRGQELK